MVRQPKTREGKIVLVFSLFILLVFTVWYIITSFDLIPDTAPGGSGYIEDAILVVAVIVIALRLIHNFYKRVESSKNAYRKFFSKHSWYSMIFTKRFIIIVVLVSATVWYWNLVFDLIPDTNAVVGYFDDISGTLVAFAAFLKILEAKPK